ncbi:CHAT domain-containing tetratricopeptide repeat protein [Mucilaginibacter xinganensis]|uniref:CHAT domain-containing protein n=1 Tax=Mucilaginibacter xinganensis TaxID=1234841 RepID=A0A223NWV3_9SPHI|nr:CHAT domain-containing tetratricopeptide repeat protein [Mucilaginibacter xinganensis]ASU34270.1 hypothetical protein MuYL_2381 [Mucilaginibacter xinganensis]
MTPHLRYPLFLVILLILTIQAKAQTWNKLNDAFVDAFQSGRYKEAEQLGKKALAKSGQVYGMDHLNYATSAYYLGRAERQLGNNDVAEPLLIKASAIRLKKLGVLSKEYIEVYNSLGLLCRDEGRFREAGVILVKVLALNEKTLTSNSVITATSMDNLAGMYFSIGAYEKAEPLFESAVRVKINLLGDKDPHCAVSMNNLGMLFLEKGVFDKAERLFRQALAIYDQAYEPPCPPCATEWNNLGLLYSDRGNDLEAARYFVKALRIKKETSGDSTVSYATTLNNLAVVYQKEGLTAQADSLYQRALAIKLAKLGPQNPEYATGLDNLGAFYLSIKQYDKAAPDIEKGLEIRQTLFSGNNAELAESLNHLAMVAHHRGEFEKARADYQRAMSIRLATLGENHPSYIASLSNMAAVCLALKDSDQAEGYFRKANKTLIRQIKTYFPALSEKEKGLYLGTIDFHFDAFYSFAVARSRARPGLLAEMYDLQLLLKGLLFNTTSRLRVDILGSKNALLINNFREWESLREQLAKAYILGKTSPNYTDMQVDRLQQRIGQLEQYLQKNAAEFGGEFGAALDWSAIPAKLSGNSAAVELVRYTRYAGERTDSICYAALIVTSETKDHPQLVALDNGGQLDGQVLQRYTNSVERQGTARDIIPVKGMLVSQKDLDMLYGQFWAKLQAGLKGITKVYFSPDGAYNLINPNTLRNPQTGKFVFDELDIRLLTSSADLLKRPGSRLPGTPGKAILFGNPAYGMNAFKAGDTPRVVIEDLPGTQTEVSHLNEILVAAHWQPETFVAEKASEQAVKRIRHPGVLHLATHGFYLGDTTQDKRSRYADNPMLYTGLLFAGAARTLNAGSDIADSTREDGVLTGFEAENLDLRQTALVVLSACETGQGDLIRNGEGTYSLERAFKTAGAGAVLYSMWRVNDDVTQKLMAHFYTYWLGGDEMHTALRRAQADIRSAFPDPYYWGAFVLSASP